MFYLSAELVPMICVAKLYVYQTSNSLGTLCETYTENIALPKMMPNLKVATLFSMLWFSKRFIYNVIIYIYL